MSDPTLPNGSLQRKTAIFNGSQDFVDITWDVAIPLYRVFGTVRGVTGAEPNITLTLVTEAGCRVNTDARFTGKVDVTATPLTPELTTPSLLDVTPTSGAAGDPLVATGRFLGEITNVRFSDGAGGVVEAVFSIVDAGEIDVTVPASAQTGPITFLGLVGEQTWDDFTRT